MFVLCVCVYFCFANKFICIIFLIPQLILYDYVELANAEFFYYLKKQPTIRQSLTFTLFLSHSYSRVIFLRSLRCGEFDFQMALKDLVLPRPGDPSADYRGHGWWRGRAAYCPLNGVCGRSWVTRPPWAGSLITARLPGALLGSWSPHAASVVDASPSSGFSGLTSAEQRPPGLPEARPANQNSTRAHVPCVDSIAGRVALCCAEPRAPLLRRGQG